MKEELEFTFKEILRHRQYETPLAGTQPDYCGGGYHEMDETALGGRWWAYMGGRSRPHDLLAGKSAEPEIGEANGSLGLVGVIT